MIVTDGQRLAKASPDRVPGGRVQSIINDLAEEIGPRAADLIGELLEALVNRLDPSQDPTDLTRRRRSFRILQPTEFVFIVLRPGVRRSFTVAELDGQYDEETIIADLVDGEWIQR